MRSVLSCDVLEGVRECLPPGNPEQLAEFKRIGLSSRVGWEPPDLTKVTAASLEPSASRSAAQSLAAFLESLVLHEELLFDSNGPEAQIALALGAPLKEWVLKPASMFEGHSWTSSTRAHQTLYSLRKRLLDGKTVEETWQGEFPEESLIGLLGDLEFAEQVEERLGFPSEYETDGILPDTWLLQRLFNLLRERELAATMGSGYVPEAAMFGQYSGLMSGGAATLPNAGSDLLAFFDREVVAYLRALIERIVPSAVRSEGMSMPLLARHILAESQNTPIFEVVRQIRSEASAKRFRSFSTDLSLAFQDGDFRKAERALREIASVADRWRRSFFPATTATRKVRISVFFASTELEVPYRPLGRWVPRGLAFVHKLISKDLARR